jgi:hypothetical protein
MKISFRALLAVAAAGATVATAVPAQAQPCVEQAGPYVYACLAPEAAPSFRGVVVQVYTATYLVTGVGCYYPDGRPRYFVSVYTAQASPGRVILPVGGVPCM